VASYKSPRRDKQQFLFDTVFQPLVDVVEQGASDLVFRSRLNLLWFWAT
jgi:hypothetical protein